MENKILLLDDEKAIARSFARLLEKEGFTVETANSSKEFYRLYDSFEPNVILLDIDLKNDTENGIDIYRNISSQSDFDARVIVLSGKATNTQVADAMKLGADNFFEKGQSFSSRKLITDIQRSLELSRQDREIRHLQIRNLDEAMIGECDDIRDCKRTILQFAQSDLPVLITGETGTGKGVAAELIHRHSNRCNNAFKSLDVSVLPETIVESELFGHVKGAFTGATQTKQGYFEAANNGTLFIDELSNMSLENQKRLLKVIEEQKVPILGAGGRMKDVNVRVIAASNQNLAEMVNEGTFRKDLFFRLSVGTLNLPPLRDRGDDVLILIERFLQQLSRDKHNILEIELPEIRDELLSYRWPGNVRELSYFCRSLSDFYQRIDNRALLELYHRITSSHRDIREKDDDCTNSDKLSNLLDITDYSEAIREFEKQYIQHHLGKNNAVVRDTAKQIGIERTTLYKKIKQHGL